MTRERVEIIEDIGTVRITKKRGVKRISMRLHSSGEIRVSQPVYMPYSVGIIFAKSHKEWLKKHISKQEPLKLYDGLPIGKQHILRHSRHANTKTRTRLVGDELVVYSSRPNLSELNTADIVIVKKAIKRCLILQANNILPNQLRHLATGYGYSYKSIYIKPLKTRWGSCSNTKEITFNCYVMMLPQDCIDYVMLHELAHTKHMHHGENFWNELARTSPNYKTIRKKMKQLQPSVHAFYV